MTSTYATLEVSAEAYDEIREKLYAANSLSFRNGAVDMDNIALLRIRTDKNITTVGGLEMFVGRMGRGTLDTSVALHRCPFCGQEAGFRVPERAANTEQWLRAECANTSCSVATPYHYRTREDAAAAWNRRARE